MKDGAVGVQPKMHQFNKMKEGNLLSNDGYKEVT